MDPSSQPTAKTNSRRAFLANTSLAAAAATLGTSGIARAAHPFGDEVIRIGLIGSGGRGTQAVTQALNTSNNVKLVAVGDAFRDRIDRCLDDRSVRQFESKIDVPEERKFVGFDAYQNVIDSDVDLVLLATPPGFRPSHFEAAVKAGKHVFMEKPVAVDAPAFGGCSLQRRSPRRRTWASASACSGVTIRNTSKPSSKSRTACHRRHSA